MNEQLILIREQFRWGLANLTQASLNLDNEDIDYLIQQAERVDELEEKIKLERRMNKDLHKLVKFLQENPRLAQDKFGEPVSLVAISAMELLQEENKQAMTRVHALATIVTDQEQKYKDLREENRLAEEECERYKKMFSGEKGKNIELEVKVQRLRLQIGREIT